MAAGHGPMRLWTHDRWRFPLPERHRFPIDKYALLRERVVADGTARADEVLEPDPVPWAWLEAVHDRGLLERIRGGTLTLRERAGSGCRGRPSWSSAAGAPSAAASRPRASRSSTASG